jgi:tRNA(Ile2) C34 agmatinyltransferase TiaS
MYDKYKGSRTFRGPKELKGRKRHSTDVGDYLNDWSGNPFAGWKTRSSALLNFAIQKATYTRSKGTGKNRKWETKSFFTRSLIKSIEHRQYGM